MMSPEHRKGFFLFMNLRRKVYKLFLRFTIFVSGIPRIDYGRWYHKKEVSTLDFY